MSPVFQPSVFSSKRLLCLSAALVMSAFSSLAADKVNFKTQVKPVLESACIGCHGPKKDKGGLRLDTKQAAFAGGDSGEAIVPGNPAKSSLYTLTALPEDHDDIMPPSEPLDPTQMDVLKQWIEQGAEWPEGETLQQVRRISFVEDVQPILEFNCVACHRDDYDKASLSYTSEKAALTTGDSGASLKPWKSARSRLYKLTTLDADDDELMPPASKGGPLDKELQETLKLWIDQGAVWPDGLTLSPKKKATEDAGDNLALIELFHEQIVAKSPEKTPAEMKAYTTQIPGSLEDYSMVPIPGGEFVMGSSEGEEGRQKDEGPQHKVKVDPFWMGKYEVTWNQFELFMYPNEVELASLSPAEQARKKLVDACSRPTKPYVEMSFGMGKDNYPAISMTHHAANKFCQWLTFKTGQFHRLPTEAEWEYACRAGTTTAYHFGDDPSQIGEYAWFEDNSDWKYQRVGKKKPNPWGLYDMHGNVAEWCFDQYDPKTYLNNDAQADNPTVYSSKPYPHVVRGGSWDHAPKVLRSSHRIQSHADWKIQDPQLPKSIWYHTDAQFLGMRIVRPLKVPSPEEMHKWWNNGVQLD